MMNNIVATTVNIVRSTTLFSHDNHVVTALFSQQCCNNLCNSYLCRIANKSQRNLGPFQLIDHKQIKKSNRKKGTTNRNKSPIHFFINGYENYAEGSSACVTILTMTLSRHNRPYFFFSGFLL